jgi:holliday junction DNA helicase RuvA
MIAYLKGTILEKGLTYIILENNNIGYKVFVTPEILESKVGDEIKLFTYLKVSEDAQSLFGLPDFATLQFFELLITVSGVGPKVALAILSAARVDAVRQAIANQDPAIFTRISGVGLKTAEKIIVELKNKVGAFESAPGQAGASDVFDALIALGYNSREVREMINKLDSSLPQGEQIRQALKFLGKR